MSHGAVQFVAYEFLKREHAALWPEALPGTAAVLAMCRDPSLTVEAAVAHYAAPTSADPAAARKLSLADLGRKQQLVTTGAQRAMALMQPQLAQLRASLGDLQDELWQSTRHVATALAAESAAADAARRETEDEHEEVLKLQARD